MSKRHPGRSPLSHAGLRYARLVEIGTFLFLLAVGAVVWMVSGRRKRERHAAEAAHVNDHAQTMVEQRVVEMLMAYPDMNDEGIAQLVHDDLVTERVRHPAAFAWAVPATVARIRRLALRRAVATAREVSPKPAKALPARKRAARASKPGGPNEPATSGGVEVIRAQSCSSCGAKMRGDALRCTKCRAWLPRARE